MPFGVWNADRGEAAIGVFYKRSYKDIHIGYIGVVQLQYVGTEVSDVKNTEFIDIYTTRVRVGPVLLVVLYAS